MAFEFHYTPTGTGAISGKEVLEQTEDAINDLGNTAISGVQEALDKAEQALTNSENAVDDAQTALNTANNAEGVAVQAQNDVSNLSGTVTNIGNRVTTAEGNIGNLQGRMTTAEGNITNLQGRMTTAEGNIGNLQTAVSTAQAAANSAQQTAATARQQSYVLRYSSTTLVASSTNSNTLLDNTDNLKIGDKVIDLSGVIYSVTAIDTANSTFTIGTALIDLLSSSDVGAAALSNNYNDLDNLPTIPTVNDATLTIQKNGVDVQTFSANASSNVTANITVPTKTSDLTNDSGFITSDYVLPTGSYIQFAGSQAPEGFLVCNGGAVSRTTYNKLFAVIGTTYGKGNGSTTFNLPNLTDRFLQGSTTSGTVKNAGLPKIAGSFDYNCTGTTKDVTATGAISCSSGSVNAELQGVSSNISVYVNNLTFNASKSNSIYGGSSTVQPPALTCLICIKY